MKIVVTLLLFVLLTSCTKLMKWYTPDNPAEEFVEEVIKRQTGVDVDLSPWETEVEKNEC